MPIKINSTGGGSVSIDVPSTGGTYTLTAPANNATIFTTAGGAITGNVAVTGVASFSSNVTFTSNNVSIGGQTISSAVGMRNRIINGDMKIDRRNAGASSTPAGDGYHLDRFRTIFSGATKFTVQQNKGSVTPPTGFSNYWGMSVNNTVSSLASNDYHGITQAIEGHNIADLAWGTAAAKTVTLSFWVYSNVTGTFSGSLMNSAQNRSYPFTYSISSSDTWTYVTVTIPGDTTGTWLTTNGVGLRLYLSVGTGTSYSGAAGSWASSGYFAATGATSIMASVSNYWYVTGIQLEVGSVATPFEFRHITTESQLCQRYYQTFTIPSYIGMNGTSLGSGYTVYFGLSFPLKVSMRASPTILENISIITDNAGVQTFTADTEMYSLLHGQSSASYSYLGGTAKLSAEL